MDQIVTNKHKMLRLSISKYLPASSSFTEKCSGWLHPAGPLLSPVSANAIQNATWGVCVRAAALPWLLPGFIFININDFLLTMS